MSTALVALERARYISLETFRKNGTGVKTPVWFAIHDARLYVFSDGTAYKVKRVANDGRARVAACNVNGKKIESAWYDAKASLVSAGPEEDAAYAALRKKYGLQMRLLDVMSRLGGRYGRRKVIRLEPA